MADETPNIHNEFLEFTNGVSRASAVFTESISNLNKVYLDFCDRLLQSALNTSDEIVAIEKKVTGLTDTLNTATKKVKNDSLVAANKTTTEVERKKPVSSSSNNSSFVVPYQELSEQLLRDLNNMTNNFLHAQNQMYSSAAAATNMGIVQIYNGITSKETKSNKSALKSSNSKK